MVNFTSFVVEDTFLFYLFIYFPHHYRCPLQVTCILSSVMHWFRDSGSLVA